MSSLNQVLKEKLFLFFASNAIPAVLFQTIGILLFPLYSRELIEGDFSLYAQIVVLISFLNIIISLGLDSVYLRFNSELNHDKKKFYGALLALRLLTSIFVGLPLLFFLTKVALNGFRLENIHFLIIGASLIMESISSLMLTILRSDLRKRVLFRAVFIQGLIYQCALLFSIFRGQGFISFFIAMFFSSFSVFVFLYITEGYRFNFSIKKQLTSSTLSYGIKLIPHKALSKLPEFILVGFVLPFKSPVLLGFLGATAVILNPLSRLVDIFAKSWLPFRMNLYENGEFQSTVKYMRVLLLIASGLLIMLIPAIKVYFDRYTLFSFELDWILAVMFVWYAQLVYQVYNTGFEWVSDQLKLSFYSLIGTVSFLVFLFCTASPEALLLARAVPLLVTGFLVRIRANLETKVVFSINYLFVLSILLLLLSIFYE